jgi:hypothetical protein
MQTQIEQQCDQLERVASCAVEQIIAFNHLGPARPHYENNARVVFALTVFVVHVDIDYGSGYLIYIQESAAGMWGAGTGHILSIGRYGRDTSAIINTHLIPPGIPFSMFLSAVGDLARQH